MMSVISANFSTQFPINGRCALWSVIKPIAPITFLLDRAFLLAIDTGLLDG
jgi:hypothetical protein